MVCVRLWPFYAVILFNLTAQPIVAIIERWIAASGCFSCSGSSRAAHRSCDLDSFSTSESFSVQMHQNKQAKAITELLASDWILRMIMY